LDAAVDWLPAGIDFAAAGLMIVASFFTSALTAAFGVGGGVAMLNPGHFQDDVAAGRLYQPFELTGNDGRDYWLAYPENRRNVPKIRNFRKWLLEKFNVEQA